MQTYEFYATAQDGMIKIPDVYVGKITSTVNVIILVHENVRTGKRALFPDFSIDTSDFVFNREEANVR